eukprot:1042133-Alexandrium_andersonii.AAC.1
MGTDVHAHGSVGRRRLSKGAAHLQPEPALDEAETLLVRLELQLVAQRRPEVLRQKLAQRT